MHTDHLSMTFAALADPTRRAILARLSTGEASVSELAQPFEMSMPAISKHLKVLQTRRTRHAEPRSPVATVQTGARAAQGCRRLGRRVPSPLGGTVRPLGRIPARTTVYEGKKSGRKRR